MDEEQRATDGEIEMAKLMLRIADDIQRLEALREQHRSTRLGPSVHLIQAGAMIRPIVEQAATFSQCPVLRRLLETHPVTPAAHGT
ncbi:hypothetical protein SUDANB145_07317 (plasmid) [Streptomyces sp. enrichment culture]|uniref:hypothetical protein n=1 Tax=Streptomyces sp. enrichment culture TaxID=1795815 RepID=UPI003F54BF70